MLDGQSLEILAAELSKGNIQLGLSLTEKQQAALLDYLNILLKWNKAFNLSGLKEPRSILSLHILDSLSVLPYIEGACILDIGTGAGFPGIPLAISLPGKKFLLLDSNGKKTRFLLQVLAALKLDNVEIINQRVEEFRTAEKIDIIISRAFSSLKTFVHSSAHLLGKNTKMLAMKGLYPTQEVQELPPGFLLKNSYVLSIPGELTSRHLLEIMVG